MGSTGCRRYRLVNALAHGRNRPNLGIKTSRSTHSQLHSLAVGWTLVLHATNNARTRGKEFLKNSSIYELKRLHFSWWYCLKTGVEYDREETREEVGPGCENFTFLEQDGHFCRVRWLLHYGKIRWVLKRLNLCTLPTRNIFLLANQVSQLFE